MYWLRATFLRISTPLSDRELCLGKFTGTTMTWRKLIASLLLVETSYAKTDWSKTMDNNANGSKYSGKLSGWIENCTCFLGDMREEPRATGTNITSCQACLADAKRLATKMKGHLSALDRHSIVSIHEFLGRLAKLLLMSVERSLCRSFSLWSNSRQMTPLAVCPIERCRVSRNAVLYPTVSATVNNEQQGDMLTSQTTTVLGAHLTRVWKSWPRAIWSYKNFNRYSLSSCLYPMI